jgi:hypothetical protein
LLGIAFLTVIHMHSVETVQVFANSGEMVADDGSAYVLS